MTQPGFDRIRPRGQALPELSPDGPTDHDGRGALWSDVVAAPSVGAVTITCSSCQERSVVGLRAAARAAIPSLHLPYLRRDHGSFMLCPACGRRTWVRLGLHL